MLGVNNAHCQRNMMAKAQTFLTISFMVPPLSIMVLGSSYKPMMVFLGWITLPTKEPFFIIHFIVPPLLIMVLGSSHKTTVDNAPHNTLSIWIAPVKEDAIISHQHGICTPKPDYLLAKQMKWNSGCGLLPYNEWCSHNCLWACTVQYTLHSLTMR